MGEGLTTASGKVVTPCCEGGCKSVAGKAVTLELLGKLL